MCTYVASLCYHVRGTWPPYRQPIRHRWHVSRVEERERRKSPGSLSLKRILSPGWRQRGRKRRDQAVVRDQTQ